MRGLYVTKNVHQINLPRQEHGLDAPLLPRALGLEEMLVVEMVVRSNLPGLSLYLVLLRF